MRILLTNDDGIAAPGIDALHDALVDANGDFGTPLGEVYTVAPATVQSATSHGVTFNEPLMVYPAPAHPTMRGIAVGGRPADCVKLAVANLWPEQFGAGARPDLVISGMNAGANAGINVIYSGTVAAALEAAFLGLPAIAVSLLLGGSSPNWAVAARHARHAIERVLGAAEGLAEGALPAHACININVPATEQDGPTPDIAVCPMNTHGLNDKFERCTNPAGEPYYWAAGSGLDFRGSEKGADVDMLTRGHITVTPLHYDLTSPAEIGPWRDRLMQAPAQRS